MQAYRHIRQLCYSVTVVSGSLPGVTVRLVLVALFFISGTPTVTLAWGDTGHKVICELAPRLAAAPDARATFRRLIQTDAKFDYFATHASGRIIRASVEKGALWTTRL